MCIELGLHRRDSLFKVVPNEAERANVLRMFWAIYVLDRRWSFGTGLPFALQDADIDPNLPEPVSLHCSLSRLILIVLVCRCAVSQYDDSLLSDRIKSLALYFILCTTSGTTSQRMFDPVHQLSYADVFNRSRRLATLTIRSCNGKSPFLLPYNSLKGRRLRQPPVAFSAFRSSYI